MLKVICSLPSCNNEYYVSDADKKVGRGKYCSHKCYGIDKRGKTLSEEHKQNIGKATKKMWQDGVFDAPHIREAYARRGRATKGSTWTEEQKLRVSKRMKGKLPKHLHTLEVYEKSANAKRGKIMPEETKEKISVALKGREFSENHRNKLSEAHKTRSSDTYLWGDKNPNWRGGISKRCYPNEFRVIKSEIRERDNYTCQICRIKQTERSGVIHHIDANKKNNDKTNLILLCRQCHGKVHAQNRTKNPIIRAFRSMLKY
jgi:5-methylcytosine-specific restriction endonuclease McrA